MEDFSRVAQMPEAELVRWRFLLDKAVRMDAAIAELQAVFANWKRPPDADLLAASEACQAELARRAREKGG